MAVAEGEELGTNPLQASHRNPASSGVVAKVSAPFENINKISYRCGSLQFRQNLPRICGYAR